MDGVVDKLLRLENAKHKALISLDSTGYERSVREQTDLLAGGLSISGSDRTEKLLVFSNLANLNTLLYKNLLAMAPSLAVPSPGYSGDGHINSAAHARTFSAKA